MRCRINDTWTFSFAAKFLVLYHLIIGKYVCCSTCYKFALRALSWVHKLLPYHKSINSSNQEVVIICYTCYKSLYFFCFLFYLGHIQSSGKEVKRLIWGKRDPSEVNKVVLEFTQGKSRNKDNAEFEPTEFYKRLKNNELLDNIVDESNKYAMQTNLSSPLNLTRNELGQFFGILYEMILVKMPSTWLYWCTEFNYDKVASIMTVSQFEKIKKITLMMTSVAQKIVAIDYTKFNLLLITWKIHFQTLHYQKSFALMNRWFHSKESLV